VLIKFKFSVKYNWIRSIVHELESLSRGAGSTARNCGYMRDHAVVMPKRKRVPEK